MSWQKQSSVINQSLFHPGSEHIKNGKNSKPRELQISRPLIHEPGVLRAGPTRKIWQLCQDHRLAFGRWWPKEPGMFLRELNTWLLPQKTRGFAWKLSGY